MEWLISLLYQVVDSSCQPGFEDLKPWFPRVNDIGKWISCPFGILASQVSSSSKDRLTNLVGKRQLMHDREAGIKVCTADSGWSEDNMIFGVIVYRVQ